MLVTLSDATVTSVENAESYEFDTDAGFLIDDWITGKEVLATPEVGTSQLLINRIVSTTSVFIGSTPVAPMTSSSASKTSQEAPLRRSETRSTL